MQQVKAYRDGDHRWVIVIEGEDENLDRLVETLVTELQQGTIAPGRSTETATAENGERVTCDMPGEKTVEGPVPPAFVRRLQEDEKKQSPKGDSAEQNDPEGERYWLPDGEASLPGGSDRKLKELSFRMFHTADISLALRVESPEKIREFTDRYKAFRYR